MNRISTRRAGVTLVELLVVIVILAIMGGLAAVTSSSDDDGALDLAAMQIGDAVDRALALAVSARVAHGVVFDTAGDRFAVVDESGNVVAHPVTKKDWVVDFRQLGQPELVDIASASFGDAGATILIGATGHGLQGGTLVLVRGGSSRTLTFDAASGMLD